MGATGKATITASKQDFTQVTFKPDLSKFKMTHLDKDTVALMTRRAYDMAGCTKGVAVYLNGKKLPVSAREQYGCCYWTVIILFLQVHSFKDYVQLYLKSQVCDDEEGPRKVVHEVVNPRWEVCVTASDSGFQQASFVNSIATTKVTVSVGREPTDRC